MGFKVAIANDHGGFALKRWLIENYQDRTVEWVDLGTESEESVDYPDFAHKLADYLKDHPDHYGIAICGTGIGISMALNRHNHIRAAVCTNSTMARLTRIDNDANVLCFGARVIGEQVVRDCLSVFLTTDFETGGRHERRVNKINTKEG